MAKYVPHTEEDIAEMLKTVGVTSLDGLYASVPEGLRAAKLNLPQGVSEEEALEKLTALSDKNKRYDLILRGAGAYSHYIPPMVTSIVNRSEFVTAYTPYQAELSQGILQSIFEYQTMMANLTGMEVSNAGVYDGATAAAEAIGMYRTPKTDKAAILSTVRPDVLRVIKTYLEGYGVTPVIIPAEGCYKGGYTLPEGVCAVYMEQPNYYGIIEDIAAVKSLAAAGGAKLVVGLNPIAAALLKTPGECGADAAVGEGQPLGLPLNFGGPYLGFMTTTEKDVRKLPGRIVGETTDADGNRAFVLTLQAREQHIRREKALSNICSNEALCALTSSVYLTAMGKDGLEEVASTCAANAHYLAAELCKQGFALKYSEEFFHEFVTVKKGKSDAVLAALDAADILGGLKLSDDEILWCATETSDKESLDAAVSIAGRA